MLLKKTSYNVQFRDLKEDVREEGFKNRAIKLILSDGRQGFNPTNYK